MLFFPHATLCPSERALKCIYSLRGYVHFSVEPFPFLKGGGAAVRNLTKLKPGERHSARRLWRISGILLRHILLQWILMVWGLNPRLLPWTIGGQTCPTNERIWREFHEGHLTDFLSPLLPPMGSGPTSYIHIVPLYNSAHRSVAAEVILVRLFVSVICTSHKLLSSNA